LESSASNEMVPNVCMIFLMIEKTIPTFEIILFEEELPKLHVGAYNQC
jgi:hypothetical protein